MIETSLLCTDGIADLVERYAAAARRGNSAEIADCFLIDARIRGRLDGAIVDRSAAEFLAFIDESGPSPGLEIDVVSLSAAGSAAAVQLACRNWLGVTYSDFLSLVRRDGGWRIAGKVFHAHDHA